MKRSCQSLPARTRWEFIFGGVLLAAIAAVLAIPGPRSWSSALREKPALFQLMENDYLQPMLASPRGVYALNAAVDGFAGFGGYDEFKTCVRVPSGPALANITRFAGDTLSLLGVTFVLRDTNHSVGPRVFVSEEFWEREYRRDVSVLGRPIIINGHPYRIAGITRQSVSVAASTDVWMPILAGEKIKDSACLRVIGAMRTAGDWKQARKELARKLAAGADDLLAGVLARPTILPVERGVYFGAPETSLLAEVAVPKFALVRRAS